METRHFGKTDIWVSALGFGGAEIGFEKVAEDVAERVLNDALDAGLNVIDTAECYMDSEELIGRIASTRRKDYYLFTKCGHPEGGERADWGKASLLASIERSLRRLKTDRLDLVQLHSCSEEELRKGEVIEALEEARKRGYTRYIGYSGDGAAALYAVQSGAFDSLQTSLSVVDQEAIDLTLELAHERGMGIIAKRPIGNAVWRFAEKPDNSYIQTYWERFQALGYDFAKEEPVRTASVALRFTLSVPGVDTAIVGSARPGRWRENAELLQGGRLNGDQFDAIRARWKTVADETWTGQV